MPEIKKRIVIASVLKPLNDTRMTEKIAFTLAENPSHELHVIGFPAAIPADGRITFHTFPAFKRLSVSRWLTAVKVLRIIFQIKPDVIIVTTHELLFAGAVAKILLGAKLVYDVQENYYLNILHTKAFPRVLKFAIAEYVRLKEQILAAFVDHFFLAEKVYAHQLNFCKSRFTIIENKATYSAGDWKAGKGIRLIFSGTLSRSTGVFRAIDLAKALRQQDETVTLTLIGYAALAREFNELTRAISGSPFITLIGGNRLVNHNEIMEAIWSSDSGIISYERNAATQGRIPTKLYEYLGCSLPVIFVDGDTEWTRLATTVAGEFFELNSNSPDISSLISWLNTAKPRGTFNDQLSWKTEAIRLQTAISAL